MMALLSYYFFKLFRWVHLKKPDYQSLHIFLILSYGVLMTSCVQICKSVLEIPKIETAVFLGNKSDTFSKNKHVNYEMIQKGSQYYIHYEFADHKGIVHTFNTQYKITQVQKAIENFGLPKHLFRPQFIARHSKNGQEVVASWEYASENKVRPNINKLIKSYRKFAKPIAEFTMKTLGENASDREYVEFILKFCQDIPFGIPPSYNGNQHIGGLLIPPHLLLNGYGDCDSKVVLFASILSYFSDIEMILLYMPNHLGIAVKTTRLEEDEYVMVHNTEFVIAEPTGPIRLPLGKKGHEHGRIYEIVPISTHPKAKASSIFEHVKYFNHTGSITFWTDVKDEGEIEVFLDNYSIGKLNLSFDQKPECRNINALVIDKKVGKYQLEARSRTGSLWSGVINVKPNTCKLVRIGH